MWFGHFCPLCSSYSECCILYLPYIPRWSCWLLSRTWCTIDSFVFSNHIGLIGLWYFHSSDQRLLVRLSLCSVWFSWRSVCSCIDILWYAVLMLLLYSAQHLCYTTFLTSYWAVHSVIRILFRYIYILVGIYIYIFLPFTYLSYVATIVEVPMYRCSYFHFLRLFSVNILHWDPGLGLVRFFRYSSS